MTISTRTARAESPALEQSTVAEAAQTELRRRFVETLSRLAPDAGRYTTPWPGLGCMRATRRTSPDPTVYSPSLCIVAQGAKHATLGGRTFRYDPFHYLVIGAHMPLHATIVEASEEQPFLSMVLDVDVSAVRELLVEMEGGPGEPALWDREPPLKVSPLDDQLLGAVLRLLDAVEDPLDRKILAPPALREILYLLLRRDQGALLRLAARRDGHASGVARALHYIRTHLDERLDVPTIAREVGMSTSSLHHSFKATTTLTPIQYLKRLRLHRARQLMVDEGCLAAEAAFKVGYESPSQFSRDFRQLFGMPPRRYVGSWARAAGA
jgi:AraC-like DNA-binding protein